jgi:hypothetical protein
VIAILISLPAICISLYTLVEIKAFKKSTHKVEFVPMNAPEVSPKVNKEFMEGFGPDMGEGFMV